MEKYNILISGNGVTSRPNLEALLEDQFYANGKDGTLVLPVSVRPTQGQIFAFQLARDKNIDTIVFAKPTATFEGLPSVSVTETETPLSDAVKHIEGTKAFAFLLYSADADSAEAVALCNQLGVPAFDLTEGLVPLTKVEEPATEYENVVVGLGDVSVPVAECPPITQESFKADFDPDFIKALADAVASELDARNKAAKG